MVFSRGLHAARRSPHGERGLKFLEDNGIDIGLMSLPTRGAWIEMLLWGAAFEAHRPSLPTRGAWIEIGYGLGLNVALLSLPTRGAWIEMCSCYVTVSSAKSLPTRGAWIEIGPALSGG